MRAVTISDRYRALVEEVEDFLATLGGPAAEATDREVRLVTEVARGLAELQERVGEIPRIRLEAELTPILLRAHTRLDRARLLLEERGDEDRAATVWELEQHIYRVLNDL
jgi:hypothetical protein